MANPWLMGYLVLSLESVRAENQVLKSVSSSPPYDVKGPLVSVVIPTYNEESYLPSLLTALDNQTYVNIEKVVVDNISEDRTVEIAGKAGAKVISNPEYNLSLSRNMGAKESSGDILVFMDADTVPSNQVIERASFELTNGSDIVSFTQCSTDSHLQSMMRVGASWITSMRNGAFIGVTKDMYNAVGGFDETALPQEGRGEDVEFFESVMKNGGRLKHIRGHYIGISARRQKAEGYLVSQHWQARAIRGLLQ